ncbi:MAG TPA: hypothetical protein VFE89_07445 [Beijerinckiaceae bacterium]|nr:hypothetical protein [Beijerinckiaceae bacterium]
MDFLADLGSHFAHEPRQTAEQTPDWLHAGAHDCVLQIGGQSGETL